MWYTNAYRRHLCDMHIDDWDERFLSEFSAEEYCDNLKRAKIQSAMVYFQSHVGHCYFPTHVGHMHRALIGRETMIRELAERCHANGIFVTGYYSLIYNTWAHDHHPEWRMVFADGQSQRAREGTGERHFSDASVRRYGLCCPNNADYRAFVFAQMEEFNAFFDFEGMFFDMLFWPHMCYCPSCRARWEKEVGGEMPTRGDWNDPLWRLHIQKRNEWMGEFAEAVASRMRKLRPGISVEHNLAMSIVKDPTCCNNERVNNCCDYAGGDLYGGILEQSFTCKFYRNITQNQPFEYMASRCTPNLSAHTATKSREAMLTSMFLTAAHHGATLMIDAIDPVGTLDQRVYERFGEVFAAQIPYEPYFHGDMMEDVGIYASIHSKFNLNGNDFSNHECCVAAVKTMIRRKILTGVTGRFHSLDGYRAIVAPCLTYADECDNERLLRYVQNGGTLYLSGAENRPLLKALFGAEVEGYTAGKAVYAAPCPDQDFGWFNRKYPMPFESYAPLVRGIQGRVLATLTLPYTAEGDARFASIHSNPPGIETDLPAMVERAYGKGRAIWSAVPLELSDNAEYADVFLKLLDVRTPSLVCGDESDVELVAFRTQSGYTLSAVDLYGKGHERPGLDICLRCERQPACVRRVPDAQPLPFRYADGYVHFETGRFAIFAMYEITL